MLMANTDSTHHSCGIDLHIQILVTQKKWAFNSK